MKYKIFKDQAWEGSDYETIAQFNALHSDPWMEIEAVDETDAVKQFNEVIKDEKPKWRATAGGIRYPYVLVMTLTHTMEPSGKVVIDRWVVK